MSGTFMSRHRRLWPLFGALLLASAASSALVAARIAHTGRLTYAFLVYNLALAWVPVGFAAAAHAFAGRTSRGATLAAAACSAGWLLFLPNAPYLLTDLMHLRVQSNRLLWFDVIALPSLAWTGLALGFASLFLMQGLVAERVGRAWSWLFAAASIGASAFGVYLGRFRRWNSWDVVLEPRTLLQDILGVFAHPFPVVAYCAALSGVLLVAYLVFYAWSHVSAGQAPSSAARAA
jgi:uncharacterized membrane protein